MKCHYFHGTGEHLPTGAILTARGMPLEDTEPMHRMADEFAPKGKPLRHQSFFLGTDPSELLELGSWSVKNIYNVEPVGNYHKGDEQWLIAARSEWRANEHRFTPRLVGLILQYWDGLKSSEFRGWEVLAPRIRICGRLREGERRNAVRRGERKHPGIIMRSLTRTYLLAGERDEAVNSARHPNAERLSHNRAAHRAGVYTRKPRKRTAA